MCRNIKTLANFDPPATHDEIRASALQFVRKLSGMNQPSRANEAAFARAVDEVTASAERLIAALTVNAAPRNRDIEAMKARERSRRRFAIVLFAVFASGWLAAAQPTQPIPRELSALAEKARLEAQIVESWQYSPPAGSFVEVGG